MVANPPRDPQAAPRPTTPEAHARTRADHASEVAEDYVEAVAETIEARGECRVADLAERFAVSHVTVSRIVRRLVGEGLLETEPYRPVTLTHEGARLAERCRERHDLVYRFLLALGVSPEVATLDSEGLEHHLSEETLARIRAFVAERAG